MNTRTSIQLLLVLALCLVTGNALARPGFDRIKIRTWDRTLLFYGCTIQAEQGQGDPNPPGIIVASCNVSMFTLAYEGLNYSPTVYKYTTDVLYPGYTYRDERCVIRSIEWTGTGNQDLMYNVTCFDTASKMSMEDSDAPTL